MASIQDEFQQSYHELFDRTYRFVRCRIPDTADCEDLVAHILTHAYQGLSRYRVESGPLSAYVMGIAKHKIVDYWRRKRFTQINLDDVAEFLIDESVKSAAERYDETEAFTVLMQQLTEEEHALFTLHYIDGLTYAEIAQLIDKSPESVRKFFSIHHRKLRTQYPNLNPYTAPTI